MLISSQRRAESIGQNGTDGGDDSGVPKHASRLLEHVTACETSDALQEIHDQQIKDESSPIQKCNSAFPLLLEKKKKKKKRVENATCRVPVCLRGCSCFLPTRKRLLWRQAAVTSAAPREAGAAWDSARCSDRFSRAFSWRRRGSGRVNPD